MERYDFRLVIYCESNGQEKVEIIPGVTLLGVKQEILENTGLLHITSLCNGCCAVREVTADGDPNSTPAKTLMSWITINQGIGNL